MWLRRTKSKTRIHNSFSCSSFKDIQSLCAADDNSNNGNNNNNLSSPVTTTRRTAAVFHRVRRANSVLAALSALPPKDTTLPVLPLDQNGNAHLAPVDELPLHLKEDPSVPVLPLVKEDPTLPVLPSEQYGNPDIATSDHQAVLKDSALPVIPPEQIGNSNVAPIQLPEAENRIVIYFTSLRIVRSTFEDCKAARSILRAFRVSIDERDLSMDSRYSQELQRIFGQNIEKSNVTLPRVFINGRYIGGAEEVRQLHEAGELKKCIEGLPPADPGNCEVCGGYGFILCDECNGSRKCYSEKGLFRTCSACNENGLVRCPSCSSAPF